MFSGVKITIEGEDYIVPAISLGQLRHGILVKLQEHDALVADGKTFETMELRGQIILETLRRNYSDFTEEKLFNYLDMSNVSPIWLSILGASGFNLGEAPAVKLKANGTSSLFTEASPQLMDGHTAR